MEETERLQFGLFFWTHPNGTCFLSAPICQAGLLLLNRRKITKFRSGIFPAVFQIRFRKHHRRVNAEMTCRLHEFRFSQRRKKIRPIQMQRPQRSRLRLLFKFLFYRRKITAFIYLAPGDQTLFFILIYLPILCFDRRKLFQDLVFLPYRLNIVFLPHWLLFGKRHVRSIIPS